MAQMALPIDTGREITRDEAMSIIEQNQKQGLVLQPSNTEKVEFILICLNHRASDSESFSAMYLCD